MALDTFDGRNRRNTVRMEPHEVAAFLETCRNLASFATINRDGTAHVTPIGFGLVDGLIHLCSKPRSQKVINVRRDDRATLMIHDGSGYENFRGVQVVGQIEVVDDPALVQTVMLSTSSRYRAIETASPENQSAALASGYVALRMTVTRNVSWDHRKLL